MTKYVPTNNRKQLKLWDVWSPQQQHSKTDGQWDEKRWLLLHILLSPDIAEWHVCETGDAWCQFRGLFFADFPCPVLSCRRSWRQPGSWWSGGFPTGQPQSCLYLLKNIEHVICSWARLFAHANSHSIHHLRFSGFRLFHGQIITWKIKLPSKTAKLPCNSPGPTDMVGIICHENIWRDILWVAVVGQGVSELIGDWKGYL